MLSLGKWRQQKSTSKICPMLELKEKTLHYTIGDARWTLAISDIICIAEYTTDAGPFTDDYFLVFGINPDNWYEASFYCDGRDEVLAALSQYMRHPLQFGLCNSTTYASRIIWPIELENQPLIDKVTRTPNSSLKSSFTKTKNGAADAI